jgi:hypothetical protein
VPRAPRESFLAIANLSRKAASSPSHADTRAELHARVTRAYGLDEDDFVHVLGTFPLVSADERAAALSAFRGVR